MKIKPFRPGRGHNACIIWEDQIDQCDPFMEKDLLWCFTFAWIKKDPFVENPNRTSWATPYATTFWSLKFFEDNMIGAHYGIENKRKCKNRLTCFHSRDLNVYSNSKETGIKFTL